MKKMNKKILGGAIAASILALVLAACGTTKANPAPNSGANAAPSGENNVDVQPMRSTVLDWNNRNMWQQPFPAWLKALLINNRQDAVRSEFSLADDAVVRVSQAQRQNREEARVLSDLMFAQAIANELKRYVVTAAASRLDQGSMDIVEEITSSTKVTLTGAQKLNDFWQLVETEDNGMKTRNHIWYVVYAFPGTTWGALTRKYVNDVIGQVPNRAVQTQIANAFDEIDAEAKRNNERSDAEFNQMLELQKQAAADKQKQDMARINQQTAANANAADVAKAQAKAEADARYAAYKSGNPATAAAASVTANDIDWISTLSTVASIR
ncbi:hypothetical protein FACS1894130_00600 [Spirochaetia bacterium]|nr:hypothetical protein FACS1894130_00600 [Spirochaetia bacterium]